MSPASTDAPAQAHSSSAQVPAAYKKKLYGPHTPLFENAEVVLFETMLTSGNSLPFHAHPRPHLRYCFSAGVNRHTWKDGSVTTEVDVPGAYEWRDELEHAVENAGTEDIHSLIVEVKGAVVVAPYQVYAGERPWYASVREHKVAVDVRLVRAVELTMAPGERTLPLAAKRLVYAFNAGSLRLQGSAWCVEQQVAENSALWLDAFMDAALVNTGAAPIKLLVVEIHREPLLLSPSL